ncbi:MAG: (d)CMP kinase, partial [Propionibacteriaceae bacterium]|nr:(d)CMP kinase [Propionibacteriaceae bacterium]
TDPSAPTIAVDGRDVTAEIREPRISQAVSQAATNLEVRRILTDRMRAEIELAGRDIVVEGRDITTVVAPDADLRVLLVADQDTRMNRRSAELGGTLSQRQLHDQIVRRDSDDSTVSEFMRAAPGVHLIDSTQMSLDEVVATICGMVETDE